MTGLPWVRLDSAFPFNPKVQALIGDPGGHRAVAVYLCGLSYAGLNGTDGYIPSHALPFIHGRRSDATKLVEHHFWVPAQGGWDIHDWADKQPSTEETQKRKKRAQDAALIRWHGPQKGSRRDLA